MQISVLDIRNVIRKNTRKNANWNTPSSLPVTGSMYEFTSMKCGAIHGTKYIATTPARLIAGILKMIYKALDAISLTRLDHPKTKNLAIGPFGLFETSGSNSGIEDYFEVSASTLFSNNSRCSNALSAIALFLSFLPVLPLNLPSIGVTIPKFAFMGWNFLI